MAKSLKPGAFLGVAVLAWVAWLEFRDVPPHQPLQGSHDNDNSRETHPDKSGAALAVEATATAMNAIARTPDAATLATSTDYFDFSKSMLDRAKAGDVTAQYQLYATLTYCDDTYRAFFRKPHGPPRTLEEALQRVSTRPAESIDIVNIAYARCSRLYDQSARKDFGVAENWLRLATEQGQPLALATTAEKLLTIPEELAESADAEAARSAAAKDAISMFLTALKSKDPEVVWKIGEIQSLLDGTDEERNLKQWAWWLAACQRGYDCKNSSWLEFSCRFDHLCAQDTDATDYIRRSTGLDFPEIERRAKQINADIDSESWDALGLVPPGFKG